MATLDYLYSSNLLWYGSTVLFSGGTLFSVASALYGFTTSLNSISNYIGMPFRFLYNCGKVLATIPFMNETLKKIQEDVAEIKLTTNLMATKEGTRDAFEKMVADHINKETIKERRKFMGPICADDILKPKKKDDGDDDDDYCRMMMTIVAYCTSIICI